MALASISEILASVKLGTTSLAEGEAQIKQHLQAVQCWDGFAGQALQALLARETTSWTEVPRLAYELADDMMLVRRRLIAGRNK